MCYPEILPAPVRALILVCLLLMLALATGCRMVDDSATIRVVVRDCTDTVVTVTGAEDGENTQQAEKESVMDFLRSAKAAIMPGASVDGETDASETTVVEPEPEPETEGPEK